MIIITGTIAYDYIMDFPGSFSDHVLENQTHTINLSFIVNKFDKRRGGTAGNVSYSLGLLKTPQILFSTAGSDFGAYKKEFEKIGINCSNVKVYKKEYSATGFAMTDKSDNQIWGYFYGASENIKNLKLSSVAKKGDLVLVGPSGAEGSMSLLNQCIKRKIDYMFDPGFILTQVNNKDLTKGIKSAKYIIGNDYEIKLIKNRVKISKALWDKKIVITTLGAKGVVIQDGRRKYLVKAARPSKIIDPTGAGDAFRSGFLAGLSQEKNIETCGRMGAVCASFALEKYGGQQHKFSKKDFTTRYRQTYGSLLE